MSTWGFFREPRMTREEFERLRLRADLAASRMRRARRAEGGRAEDLEQQVGELALLCRALVAMLKELGHFDAAAFHAALDRIDLEDGVKDGRVTPARKRPAPRPPSASPVQAPVPRKRT